MPLVPLISALETKLVRDARARLGDTLVRRPSQPPTPIFPTRPSPTAVTPQLMGGLPVVSRLTPAAPAGVPPGTRSIGRPIGNYTPLAPRQSGNEFLLEQFRDLARAPERGSSLDFPGGELLEFLRDAAQVAALPFDAFGEAIGQAVDAVPGATGFGERARAFQERPVGEQIALSAIDPSIPLGIGTAIARGIRSLPSKVNQARPFIQRERFAERVSQVAGAADGTLEQARRRLDEAGAHLESVRTHGSAAPKFRFAREEAIARARVEAAPAELLSPEVSGSNEVVAKLTRLLEQAKPYSNRRH